MATPQDLGGSDSVVGSAAALRRFRPRLRDTSESADGLGRQKLFVTGLLIAGVTTLAVGGLVGLASRRLAADFWLTYLPGAQAVVDGESPYPQYTYPPQVAFAYVPLTFLPGDLAAFLCVLASAGLIIATLAILGVRDIHCYLAVFLWAPTWQELDMANITPALALGLALAWRHRASPLRSGVALGLVVPAKIFLWPVLCWTLAMRRFRACATAISLGLSVTLGTWAAIRFEGLTTYPSLLRHHLEEQYGQRSFSFVGMASAVGLDMTIGEVTAVVVGAGLLVGCVLLARAGDDLRSFTLAIAAALALTPIIWLHYLLLLLVPLAIARPRFSPLWLLPAILWLCWRPTWDGYESFLPALVITIIVCRLVFEAPMSSKGVPALRRVGVP
jgi:Glycosyltransferase family 87